MLITTKLDNCPGCENLGALIDELDCYISKIGKKKLDNSRYSLGRKISLVKMKAAIRYKTILIARTYNPNYVSRFSLADITNKIKQITYGL
jgi:hypothetical protein